MLAYTPPKTVHDIPVIDLSESFTSNLEKKKSVAWEIHKACRTTGFFYIKNHGVPVEIVNTQLKISRDFFALSSEEKLKIDFKKSKCLRGYESMSSQTLDEGSAPDLKEGFMAGKNLLDTHPYVVKGFPQHGQNQWLESFPLMRNQTELYIEYMEDLGKHLAGLLALSLDLDENYFAEGFDESVVITRMLHYPAQGEKISNNQIGAGAHTDWGLLTMLLQDEVGGLEVRNSAGEWIRAPYIADTFVVNLGDLVQLMTKGLYRSNMHRVFNSKQDVSRYSVPTFFDLDYMYKVKPIELSIPVNQDVELANDFEELTVGQYIEHMHEKTYGLKK